MGQGNAARRDKAGPLQRAATPFEGKSQRWRVAYRIRAINALLLHVPSDERAVMSQKRHFLPVSSGETLHLQASHSP